jgi:hypothetical protein
MSHLFTFAKGEWEEIAQGFNFCSGNGTFTPMEQRIFWYLQDSMYHRKRRNSQTKKGTVYVEGRGNVQHLIINHHRACSRWNLGAVLLQSIALTFSRLGRLLISSLERRYAKHFTLT